MRYWERAGYSPRYTEQAYAVQGAVPQTPPVGENDLLLAVTPEWGSATEPFERASTCVP